MKTFVLIVACLAAAVCGSAADKRQYEEFVGKVRTCCERGDIDGLKKLYYFEGTPDVMVDQEIYMWELIIA